MKLLVIVIMLVMVPFVFADDVVWQTATPQEQLLWSRSQNDADATEGSVKKNPQEQTKAADTQSRAEPILTPSNTQSLANVDSVRSPQSRENVQKHEEIEIQKEANKIQWVLAGLTFVLVVIGAIVGWRQMQIMAKQMEIMAKQTDQMESATRYAGDAALAAKESADAAKDSTEIADRSMRVANRAYLLVKNWTVTDLRDGTEAKVACHLLNAGRTPATLEKRGVKCEVRADLPQPLTPRSLNDIAKLEMPVNAQGEPLVDCRTEHIGTEKFTGLQDKTQFLYARICFVYADVFGERYWVISSARYDMDIGLFVAINEPDYNRHGIYREEDWAE